MKHRELSEQVVVVVGASSGIGRATVLAAARAGAQVVASSRDAASLEALAAEASPGRVAVHPADVTVPSDMTALADATVERFGRIDTWAHVAGVVTYAPFEQTPVEEFRRVVEVDLMGPVHGARAALPHLRASHGALVVVSSEIAKRSFPLASAYSAAKHGVNGLVEALRVELAHDRAGVSLVEIQPEAVSTPFFEHARTRLGVRPSGPPPVTTPERVADRILHAVQHGGHTVPVGLGAKQQLLLQRLSPRLMDAFSLLTAFRLQRSSEPKGPDDGDALDAHAEGADRVRGVVTNAHR